MNQQQLESGYEAYQTGNWAQAAAVFADMTASGEADGRTYHLLGNCYMKMRRFEDAAAAYSGALDDTSYGMVGALNTNRGRALVAAGKLPEAVDALVAATADSTYATPYKAYNALGSAYRALGDVRNAGIAYRNAAIDESNPDPSASLRKLGSCFMDLGRPNDAVESYRTAIDFTTDVKSVNATYCELALAYVAANQMPEAVDAFEHATSDGTFTLSPEAQASYDAARNAVVARSGAQKVSDTDDFLSAAGYGGYPVNHLDPTGETSDDLMPSPDDTGFFSVDEKDIVMDDRRRRKKRGGKVFIVILIIMLLVAAAAGFAYYSGFGWPTQESVVEDIFAEKTNSGDIDRYITKSLSEEARDYIKQLVPSGATVKITGVTRSMSNSTVTVSATLADGGEQNYEVKLVRDGIGWKVSEFEPVFLSVEGDAKLETTEEATSAADSSASTESSESTESAESTSESTTEEAASEPTEESTSSENSENTDAAATNEGTAESESE